MSLALVEPPARAVQADGPGSALACWQSQNEAVLEAEPPASKAPSIQQQCCRLSELAALWARLASESLQAAFRRHAARHSCHPLLIHTRSLQLINGLSVA